MRCIFCQKDKIKHYETDSSISEEQAIFDVEKTDLNEEAQKYYKKNKLITDANSRMWHGGIVNIITAGYGSSHDTDQYVIAMCDDCVTEKEANGVLLYHSNYMSPAYGEESKEKSKSLYRRNKNLDDLL